MFLNADEQDSREGGEETERGWEEIQERDCKDERKAERQNTHIVAKTVLGRKES